MSLLWRKLGRARYAAAHLEGMDCMMIESWRRLTLEDLCGLRATLGFRRMIMVVQKSGQAMLAPHMLLRKLWRQNWLVLLMKMRLLLLLTRSNPTLPLVLVLTVRNVRQRHLLRGLRHPHRHFSSGGFGGFPMALHQLHQKLCIVVDCHILDRPVIGWVGKVVSLRDQIL